MCGISGEIRFKGEMADTAPVRAMAEAMGQRGPDSIGLFHQNHIAVGHRRLKIIDHSEAAQQPMIGLTIVFNGCIYNYPELRKELQQLGYHFFSNGDTEVILKAYHAWGADCLKRLSGMFAFCIWERDSGRSLIARDRLGIKPLYLAELPGGVRFCSSLPALARTPGAAPLHELSCRGAGAAQHPFGRSQAASWQLPRSGTQRRDAREALLEPWLRGAARRRRS